MFQESIRRVGLIRQERNKVGWNKIWQGKLGGNRAAI